MNLNIIESRLIRDNCLPDDFRFHRWECFPHGAPTIYVEVEGGRCPLVKTGKRKGKPNWRNLSECRTFFVSVSDAESWEAEYEQETGNCRRCRGDGREVAKFGVNCETEYRPCGKCSGTGKRVIADLEAKPC